VVASDNKSEQATPRRRQKAREKGQVARSRELITSLGTGVALAVVAWQASAFFSEWRELFSGLLSSASSNDLRLDGTLPSLTSMTIFRIAVLAMGLSWLVGIVAALAQGGLVVAPSSLVPNPTRMSPATKVRELFSWTALSNLLKSLLPVAAIVYIALAVLARDWPVILRLQYSGARELLGTTLGLVFEVGWKSTLILLIWAGADYLFQRFKFEHDLRMSRQELVDELKETEGHPTIKARIRRLQRQVRRRRMLKDTERATVVVTNPTEFAVALEYRPEMAAPVVVAKGRNLLAQQIKQVARWHQIPMVENPPLAHALYRAVEVGQTIPPKLYAVVAEVLALIYRAQVRVQQAAGGF
jgi:flagellar biosynthetic protein FlhB